MGMLSAATTPITTLILKVANRCNIDCDYCYVFNLYDQSWKLRPKRMEMDVVREVASKIATHARGHRIDNLHIVLHGGEPLLVGASYFDEMLRTLRVVIEPVADIDFVVQTNGMLISIEWLDVFERHEVSVGVSLDGPPIANDRHRLSHSGGSTAAAAVRGIETLLTRQHLFAGILAVVDIENDPVEVHDYLASFQPPVIDMNLPHRSYDDPPIRTDQTKPEYGYWLSDLFDAWMCDTRRHSIRMLEDIVALLSGVQGSVETVGVAPPGLLVVEPDGSIEFLDPVHSPTGSEQFFNISKNNFDEILKHPMMEFRQSAVGGLSDTCRGCSIVDVCGGGYLPQRYRSKSGYDNPSVYCADLKYLINHIDGHLRSVD